MPSLDEILDDFEYLEEDLERLRYVVDLGKDLPELPEDLRNETTFVRGCTSQVWLVPRVEAGDPPTYHFRADADAQIVRGLVALLLEVYSGKTADQLLSFDIDGLMMRLRLRQQLTPGRQNGLVAMVNRIRSYAESSG